MSSRFRRRATRSEREMARVYTRGKKQYIEYRDAYGRLQRKSTSCRTKAEAKDHLTQVLSIQRQLRLQLESGEKPVTPIFVRDLINRYLDPDPKVGEAIHRSSY